MKTNYGAQLTYYKVTQIEPYPGNEFGIKVYFEHTEKIKEYRVHFNDFKVPEGDYGFDSTDWHYGVNPDNSVTFFYKKPDGHFDAVKIDLEPVINAEIEDEEAKRKENIDHILYEFI